MSGSAITIAAMIESQGFQHTFMFFGILQGVLIFAMAMLLVRPQPPKGARANKANLTNPVEFTPGQMVRTPVFWGLVIVSSVSSHAPRGLRHWPKS